jgi:hypothetical protein
MAPQQHCAKQVGDAVRISSGNAGLLECVRVLASLSQSGASALQSARLRNRRGR